MSREDMSTDVPFYPRTVRQLLAALAVEASRLSLNHLSPGQRQLLAELRTERAS